MDLAVLVPVGLALIVCGFVGVLYGLREAMRGSVVGMIVSVVSVNAVCGGVIWSVVLALIGVGLVG